MLTCQTFPRIQVVFGGHDSFRESMIVEADDFVGVKSFKAKGKRLTTYTVERIEELEPTRMPEAETADEETGSEQAAGRPETTDEENGQMKLF